MATEVKLPDMGEGITDVTISRWRVKAGDVVNAGDVIVEVATDKVDTEISAPSAGVILQTIGSEGEIVPATTTFAIIGAAGESAALPAPAPAVTPAPATQSAPAPDDLDVKASPVAKRVAADKGVSLAEVTGTGMGGRITKEDVLASAEKPATPAPSAPVALPSALADFAALAVRRLAAENNVRLDEVAQGRPLSTLTRYDVMSYVASRAAGKTVTVPARFLPQPGAAVQVAAPAQTAPALAATTPVTQSTVVKPTSPPVPVPAPAQLAVGEELIKHSRMRAAVARNTSQSLFTAPHVTTMWDVEMTAVLAHRTSHKKEFAASGVNLTLTAYFVEAVVAGLKAVPAANSTWSDEGVIIKRTFNIGMAVALPADKYGMGGLIVPVIRNAGDLNLMGLARTINELAEKARANQLKQDDLAGGTFTISNYGTSGSRFQTPVIVQPQVGILGIGAVEKRAIVVSQGHPLEANAGDFLSFRPMTTLGFSYDHRVLDGATADAFCAAVKQTLESYR
jgi:pyruvate/2-oxoglutarate dehydrogenase complex dihydrolipoamide acyltransferase (E2) component